MDHDAEIVRLNVGGSLYSTTKQTLLREEDTFFNQLFEADALEKYSQVVLLLSDGTYFIDRDGELFVYVLDYLRSGKLILAENFQKVAMLREEAIFYQLDRLQQQLATYYTARNIAKGVITNGGLLTNNAEIAGGHITLGYRGTFAFGRDGQADVKFRKLHRILVCGKVSLCREVFGETLNESRDPDREGHERYTSRLYLKHQCLEKACDTMAEKGFKLIATCCSGANGLATPAHSMISSQTSATTQQELMNQRNSADYEEQRWAHYTEYVFYREPSFPAMITLPATSTYFTNFP
uniref:BTB/POZ domain-containing protein KCTD16 n=1 Tax=Ascaris suum TaxID=6253 RepID=F1L668_ASCSU